MLFIELQYDAQKLMFENLVLENEENFYDHHVYGVCEKDYIFWKNAGFLHRETAGSNVLGISSDEIKVSRKSPYNRRVYLR